MTAVVWWAGALTLAGLGFFALWVLFEIGCMAHDGFVMMRRLREYVRKPATLRKMLRVWWHYTWSPCDTVRLGMPDGSSRTVYYPGREPKD